MRKRPGLIRRGRYFHISISHCGQTVRRSLETDDPEQAAQLYDRIRAELWEGKHLNKRPEHLWEEACLKYVERCEKEIRAGERRTLDIHRIAWLNERLNGTPLTQITRKMVEKILEGHSSPRHVSAVISAVLTTAEREGYIDAKPKVMIGEPSKPRNRWATQTEAGALLKAAGYLQDAALFSLATGFRQGNTFGLRWTWLKDRCAIIPADEFKQGHAHIVPLNKTALACIQRQIGKHSEFVFTRNGEPLTKNNCSGRWIAARESAGLEDFRWHDMRHTWASWLIQAGVPENIVETLGGWSSGKMVRRYAHASVESLRPYAETLDPILAGICTEITQPVLVKAS